MTDTDLQQGFARRLVQAMEEEQMSQKDLAGTLSVHPSQVMRWRKGVAFPANLDTIGDIGQALNRAPLWLMFGISVGDRETALIMKLLSLGESDLATVANVIEAMVAKQS